MSARRAAGEPSSVRADRRAGIRAVMARELRIDVGALDDELTLQEMGLDSLAAAEIVLAVEQTLDRPVDTSVVAASITRDTSLAEFVIAIDEAIDS